MTSSSYSELRSNRYASFDSGKGKDFEEGKLKLKDLFDIASKNNVIKSVSGKQELLENILFNYIE